MKLYFRQKIFSWLDSYDVYDESGNIYFRVKGKIAWGHKLAIYDADGDGARNCVHSADRAVPVKVLCTHAKCQHSASVSPRSRA